MRTSEPPRQDSKQIESDPVTAKMIMTPTFSHRPRTSLFACVAILLLSFTAPVRAQAVAVMVNGVPITDYDIAQRSKLDFLTTHKRPSRQDVMNELIDEKVELNEGKNYGVNPDSSTIDRAYAQMASRMRLTPQQLSKTIESRGIRPETLKARIKADMVWTSLVRGRYKDRLQVTEKDVLAAAKAAGETLQQGDAFKYKMRPVILIVPKRSPPGTIERRQKEAATLRARVQSCAQAIAYIRDLPNAAIRAPVVKTSADLPAPLRKELDDTPIGHLTPPEVTQQGVEMVVLCSRKPTTDTPQKRKIRDKLYAEKYNATAKSYLQRIRGEAMIEYR
jgi:peptidyl-prolyl cis-trans isomerase SurA